MEIGSGKGPSFSQLSSMAHHEFAIDGVKCKSLEGFIQSLKCEKASQQASVCSDKPKAAKERGKKLIAWESGGRVFWKGEAIDRHSLRHKDFIEGVVKEVARQCPVFRKALIETAGQPLTCPGKSRESETPVTEAEFCHALTRARSQLLSRERQQAQQETHDAAPVT